MKIEHSTFSLDELCALVEMSKRTVRYYIQIGLVDRPEGTSRGARYTSRHVDQLLTVRKWKDAGLSLERIRELLAPVPDQGELPPFRPRKAGDVEVWNRIILADGVELCIEPKRSGLPPEELRELADRVLEAYSSLRKKEAP